MVYVDGFVIPLPRKNVAAYRSLARRSGRIWMEHGALAFRECVAEDLRPALEGVEPRFPAMTRLRRGETVVFSSITFRSRTHRDRVNAKVHADPRMAAMAEEGPMPFDIRRMAYAGFDAIVDL